MRYKGKKQKRRIIDLYDLDAGIDMDYTGKNNKHTELENVILAASIKENHSAKIKQPDEAENYIDNKAKQTLCEPEEIDKKKIFESRDKVMQANVRGIFHWVVNQFERPEMAYRELVQNSRDAETPQIDIRFTFNSKEDKKDKGVLQIDFEDYGTGMDLEDRKEFYMKLFNSSKEGNTKKTGRFGIGLVSIFALQPDEFITESCKNREAWKQHIWDLQEKDFKTRIVKGQPRQGTKITLVKYCSKNTAEEMRKNALAEIAQFCKYLRIPIYFSYAEDSPEKKEVKINKPFDVNSPVKINFKRRGIEGVIGVSQNRENNSTTELLNNRLLIETAGNMVGEGLDIIVSSEHLNYNISRNAVVRDENLEMIMKVLKHEKQNLIDAVLQKLQERVYKEEDKVEKAETLVAEKKKKDEKINNFTLWRYLSTFIKEEVDQYRDISDPLKRMLFHKNPVGRERSLIKLFKTTEGDYFTFGELMHHRRDGIPVHYTLDPERDKRLLGILHQKKAKIIILDREEKEMLDKFFKMTECRFSLQQAYYYENTGFFRDVTRSFTVQENLDDSELTPEQLSFVKIARKALKKAKVHAYAQAYLGDYSNRGYWAEAQAFFERDNYALTYRERVPLKPKKSFFRKALELPIAIKNNIFAKQDIIINTNNKTIRKYMEIARTDEELAIDLMSQHIKLHRENQLRDSSYNPVKFFTKFYGIKQWQKKNRK